ncbi:hypothetical protein B0H14DRAFT_2782134, partial [Mycena olivaceomarginata]
MTPRTKTSPKRKTQLRTMTTRTVAQGSKAKDAGPEYYEISQIRDRRVKGKTDQYEYLVRWLGWPPESDEWVDEKTPVRRRPLHSNPPDLLEAFLESKGLSGEITETETETEGDEHVDGDKDGDDDNDGDDENDGDDDKDGDDDEVKDEEDEDGVENDEDEDVVENDEDEDGEEEHSQEK